MSKKTEFLEKIYFHELERKQGLENMFAFPAGIIAGLFGLLGYYFSKFNFNEAGQFNLVIRLGFLGSAAIVLVLLLLAGFWCARAVLGSKYQHLPGAATMMKYHKELENWHIENKTKSPHKNTEEEFDKFLDDSFAHCCQINWKTNLYRSEELFRAKRAIVFALFVVVILSICYYTNIYLSSQPIKL